MSSPRTKKRRRKVIFLSLICALVVGRLAIPVVVPAALASWADSQGLRADYEELDLSVLTGEVELWHLTLTDKFGGEAAEEVVHVEYVTLDVDVASLFTGRPRIARVEADGLDLRIERDADGTIRWAQSGSSAEPVVAREEELAEASAEPLNLALPFELAALRVQEVRVDYVDHSVEPPLHTSLELGVRVSDLGSETRSARAEIRVSATEILDALRVTVVQSGDAELLELDMDVDVGGLHPRALAQLLEPLGLIPRASSIGLSLDANLEVRAGTIEQPETTLAFSIKGTEALVDGDRPFSIDQVVGNLAFGSVPSPFVRLEEIRTSGVRGEVERLPNGSLLAFGLEVGESTETAAADEPEPTAKSAPSAPSTLLLDSLVIEDIVLAFHDRAIEPATDVELIMSELRLSEFAIGPNTEGSVAKLTASLGLPGIVESLSLDGEFVVPAPQGRLNLALSTEGIHLSRIEPYLRAAGLRSGFEAGRFDCRIDANLTTSDEGLEDANFSISELSVIDGDEELFAIERIGVDGVVVTEGRVRLADIEVAGLNLPVHKNEAGDLELFGLDVLAAAPAPEGSTVAADTQTANAAEVEPVAQSETQPTVFELGRFVWRDTSVRFTDASVEPPLEVAVDDLLLEVEGVLIGDGHAADLAPPATITASLSVAGMAEQLDLAGTFDQQAEQFALDLGVQLVLDRTLVSELKTIDVAPGSETALPIDLKLSGSLGRVAAGEPIPAQFNLGVRVGESVEELSLGGELVLDGADISLQAEVRGRGIRRGELQEFLPEGLEVTLDDGRLDVALSAGLATLDEGAQRAWFELSDFVYADGEANLVTFDTTSLRLSELDQEAGRFAIEELVVRGLETDVEQSTPDRMQVAGFALVASNTPAPIAPTERPAEEGSETVEAPAPVASSRLDLASLPTVTLERLDVGISRLGYWDRTQADSEPVDLALGISNVEPLILLNSTPDELEPFQFAIRGSATPILDSIAVDLVASPYSDPPMLNASVALTGLRGAGLTRVLPELAETLDTRELENGSLTAEWSSAVKWRRRSPLDFDLASGFGAELQLRDVVYRARPDGETLIGLNSVDVDVANVNMATGDVHVRSVEISTPTLYAKQTTQGLHVLGLILKPAPEEVEDGEGAEQALEAEEPTEAVAMEASTPIESEEPGPEFRLDKLIIEGIDVRFVDETVTPAMTVPLEKLDVELAGFTTRAFEEERAMRYSINLSAGEIPLPERSDRSFFGGLARTATEMIGQGEDDSSFDSRALFEEFSVNGRLALFPAPKGWTKIELNALELLGFEGAAAKSGVTIGDGVMDSTIAIKLRGEEGIEVESTTNFQHLSLDEPDDGPISRYLALPAPLDAVLFVLKNDDGEQSIPLNFDMGAGGELSTGELAATATSTLVQIIADAIASSPLRILGSLTDVAGITDDEPEDLSEGTVRLEFGSGDTVLSPEVPSYLEGLLELMDDEDELVVVLQHELSTDDVARAAILANPDPEDCKDLAQRLRQKKRELEDSREILAAETRAYYAVGRAEEAARATEKLRAIDSELGQTEAAIDLLYEFLRPGAERRTDKRTRVTCLEIANRRLELVRQTLITAGIPSERIDVRGARFQVGEGVQRGGVQLIPKR